MLSPPRCTRLNRGRGRPKVERGRREPLPGPILNGIPNNSVRSPKSPARPGTGSSRWHIGMRRASLTTRSPIKSERQTERGPTAVKRAFGAPSTTLLTQVHAVSEALDSVVACGSAEQSAVCSEKNAARTRLRQSFVTVGAGASNSCSPTASARPDRFRSDYRRVASNNGPPKTRRAARFATPGGPGYIARTLSSVVARSARMCHLFPACRPLGRVCPRRVLAPEVRRNAD